MAENELIVIFLKLLYDVGKNDDDDAVGLHKLGLM